MDDFFHIVIKAMVIALYIYVVGYSIINNLQTWISRSNWLILISKIKRNHLEVFKVYYIQDKASRKTAIMIANIFNTKKKI